jgi:hypothetical protein
MFLELLVKFSLEMYEDVAANHCNGRANNGNVIADRV